MKNARISFLLLSVFAFQKIECKKQQPAPKKAVTVKRAPTGKRPVVSKKAAVVVEQEAHKVEVDERALQPNEVVAASIDTNTVENADGSITETKVTVTPIEEEGKVITKTETWTWYDAAKIALGVGAATGAAYLAYQNNEDFRNGVNAAESWSADQAQGFANSVSSWWNGASAQTQAAVTQEVKNIAIDNPEIVVDAAAAQTQEATDNALAQGVDPDQDPAVIEALDLQAQIAEFGADNIREDQWNGLAKFAAPALAVGGGIFAAKVPAARAAIAKAEATAAQRIHASAGFGAPANITETVLMQETAQANRFGASNPTGFAGYVTRTGEALKSGADRFDAAAGNAIRGVPFTPGSNATQAVTETAAQYAQARRIVERTDAANASEVMNSVIAPSGRRLSPQSAAGFRSNNYVNGVAPTVNPGFAKLTATANGLKPSSEAEKVRKILAGRQDQLESAQAAANIKQAAEQMANQTRIAQQIGLTGANVGIAGAIATGANALNNSDMSAPENNIDYAVEFN